MKELVRLSGYVHDLENDIWVKPAYKGIAYNDGDEVEMRIASVIQRASDLSVLSTELRRHCTDWPSSYHLSGTRANILRPFAKALEGDVLEIGAGCGTITRYLGESGANVLALEGSPRRAAIARSRTRDLENIVVLAEKFDQFQCDRQFDVVTLIGVLEYANLFTSDANPPLVMLKRVCQLLKPEGRLIVAIENQLGLKYFAGAPEDHLGQPMIGIEGRYRKDQPQTFGRKVLSDMLDRAGFAAFSFLMPLPDYKFPVSILTEEGIKDKAFDAAAFAWQSTRRDPQLPTYCNFSLELAWPAIFHNELGLDMANSFLAIASPRTTQLVETGVLATHYSTDRVAEYCKETMFSRAPLGNIGVGYRRLGNSAGGGHTANDPVVEFTCPNSERYVLGKPLSLELIGIVSNDGWSFEQVARFVWRYLSIVETLAMSTGVRVNTALPRAELPGDLFDAVPQNIIIGEDGLPSLIDREWRMTAPIEVAYLLFRSLLLLVNSLTRFGLPASGAGMTRHQFFDGVLTAAGLRLTEEDYSRCLYREATVQERVTGRAIENFLGWGSELLLPMATAGQAISARDGQLAALGQHAANLALAVSDREAQIADLRQHTSNLALEVSARDTQIAELKQLSSDLSLELSERDIQVASLKQGLAERDDQISGLTHEVHSLRHSISWRMTSPLRWVAHRAKRTWGT